jgi:hypothetical protein
VWNEGAQPILKRAWYPAPSMYGTGRGDGEVFPKRLPYFLHPLFNSRPVVTARLRGIPDQAFRFCHGAQHHPRLVGFSVPPIGESY